MAERRRVKLKGLSFSFAPNSLIAPSHTGLLRHGAVYMTSVSGRRQNRHGTHYAKSPVYLPESLPDRDRSAARLLPDSVAAEAFSVTGKKRPLRQKCTKTEKFSEPERNASVRSIASSSQGPRERVRIQPRRPNARTSAAPWSLVYMLVLRAPLGALSIYML